MVEKRQTGSGGAQSKPKRRRDRNIGGEETERQWCVGTEQARETQRQK